MARNGYLNCPKGRDDPSVLRLEKQQKERKSEMAVPRNGLNHDDGDIRGVLNALFEEDLEDIEPGPLPDYIILIEQAIDFDDLETFGLALDSIPGGIDQPVFEGQTALHMQCWYGYVDGVQLLLQRGANLEVKDEDGAIPLNYACKRDYLEIVRLILIEASEREQVKRLLDTVDTNGNTPLHHAAIYCNVDIFRLLLAYGADPTKINSEGKNPVETVDHLPDTRRELEAEVAAVARRC